ncbi:MAG: hypothetical protein M0R76_04285 [Proteobacteria bacterium]|nr:hypothetical protein [Pseudomonadota bacterium]
MTSSLARTLFQPLMLFFLASACAPIEYTVVIVEASEALEAARMAGAACTQSQLDARSPVTASRPAAESGQELASTESRTAFEEAVPRCAAPYEYYKAVEYQSKAREEVGFSDYQAALKYARASRDHARKAKKIAETGEADLPAAPKAPNSSDSSSSGSSSDDSKPAEKIETDVRDTPISDDDWDLVHDASQEGR